MEEIEPRSSPRAATEATMAPAHDFHGFATTLRNELNASSRHHHSRSNDSGDFDQQQEQEQHHVEAHDHTREDTRESYIPSEEMDQYSACKFMQAEMLLDQDRPIECLTLMCLIIQHFEDACKTGEPSSDRHTKVTDRGIQTQQQEQQRQEDEHERRHASDDAYLNEVNSSQHVASSLVAWLSKLNMNQHATHDPLPKGKVLLKLLQITGRAFFAVKEFSTSRKCFEKALEIDERQPNILRCLALVIHESSPSASMTAVQLLLRSREMCVQEIKQAIPSALCNDNVGVETEESPSSISSLETLNLRPSRVGSATSISELQGSTEHEQERNSAPMQRPTSERESGAILGCSCEQYLQSLVWPFRPAAETIANQPRMCIACDFHRLSAAMDSKQSQLLLAQLATICSDLARLYTDIGVRLKLADLASEAVHMYLEALLMDPSYAQAYYNLGVVHGESGFHGLALECYQRSVSYNPGLAEAYCNMGVIYKQLGNFGDAVRAYEKALGINPNFELAKNNMAIALCDMGTLVKTRSLKEGISFYKRALSFQPGYPDAYYNLGVAYTENRKIERAVACYELAIRFNQSHTEACNNLGVLFKDLGNLERAVACYQAALNINSSHHQTHNNLAVVYTVTGAMDLARNHFRAALLLCPAYAEAHNNFGVLLRDEGDILSAIHHYEACIQLDPMADMAAQNRLHALNYVDMLSGEYIYDQHQKWGSKFCDRIQHSLEEHRGGCALSDKVFRLRSSMLGRSRLNRKELKIGIFSADFFVHSVSYFAEVLFQHIDASRFQLFVYSSVAKEDKKTHHLKSLPKVHARWRDVQGLSTTACAAVILEDEIDILIELSGHTAGNRLDVVALGVAPVQVTWIGYPNTTGLPNVHYRVTDSVADPPNSGQKFTESLYRLPCSFLCYTPFQDAPPSVALPPCAIQRQRFVDHGLLPSTPWITFGSFNILAKLQPRCIALWARILRAVPSSRLLLKAKPFACEASRRKYELLFAQHSISSDRLDLVPLIPTTKSHLEAYSRVDIALDPFPYAGTTTTCEALYMGVPVVTLACDSKDPASMLHVQNVGASLLTSVSHPEWIAYSEDDYVKIAVDLAKDPDKLVSIRLKLRSDMMSSSLGNPAKYIPHVERMFQHVWTEQGGTFCV